MLFENMYIMLRSKILKIKYQVLLTYAKINEVKNEIPSTTSLATTTLNAKIN